MAFWDRNKENRNKESESLSILRNEAKAPRPEVHGEQRGADFRKSVWKGITGAIKRSVDVGKTFVGYFDRVVGGAGDAKDSVKAGIERAGEAMGNFTQRTGEIGANMLDDVGVLMGEAGEWVGKQADAGVDLGKAAAKKGAKMAVGGVVGGAALAYEGGKFAAAKGKEYGSAAIDWADSTRVKVSEFVSGRYENLKGWAGEQAENIQGRARDARDGYRACVEGARNFKNQTLEAYHQKKIDVITKLFAKLSPEAQSACAQKIGSVNAGLDLKNQIGI